MQFGAVISKGPSNWQILQQISGFTVLKLEGTWVPFTEGITTGKVYARIVSEDTGCPVIPWSECNTVPDGTWSAEIKNIPAGGLYRLETCFCEEGNTEIEWSIRGDMIHHLGVGDLYVIAGQSNSAGYGKDPVYDPPEPGVHILRNNGLWDMASHPLNESTGTVHEENRELTNPGNSPYLSFGKVLKRELGYPIGLVQAALGGSALKFWNPEEDGVLYRNMLNIIDFSGRKVKGILWYQGCSDTGEDTSETYLDRFECMVNNIRKQLDDPALPVITVQLNRSLDYGGKAVDVCWGKVREAQRQAAKKIKNVYVVPATDLPLSDQIHNSSSGNIVLGERIAKAALKSVYGHLNINRAPDISKAERYEEKSIKLTFENVSGRLHIYKTTPEDYPFCVEDEDGKVGIRRWRYDGGNIIILILERDLKGKAYVHGAFEQNPCRNVPVDINGYIPMLSFYGVEIL